MSSPGENKLYGIEFNPETTKIQKIVSDIIDQSRNAKPGAAGVTYASGMKRSERKPRFDLLDSDWLRGVSRVMTEGATKYGPNNWRKGDRDAAIDAINHLEDHWLKLKDGDTSEEHIYNLSCNAMFIAYYLTKYPDLFTKAADE